MLLASQTFLMAVQQTLDLIAIYYFLYRKLIACLSAKNCATILITVVTDQYLFVALSIGDLGDFLYDILTSSCKPYLMLNKCTAYDALYCTLSMHNLLAQFF